MTKIKFIRLRQKFEAFAKDKKLVSERGENISSALEGYLAKYLETEFGLVDLTPDKELYKKMIKQGREDEILDNSFICHPHGSSRNPDIWIKMDGIVLNCDVKKVAKKKYKISSKQILGEVDFLVCAEIEEFGKHHRIKEVVFDSVTSNLTDDDIEKIERHSKEYDDLKDCQKKDLAEKRNLIPKDFPLSYTATSSIGDPIKMQESRRRYDTLVTEVSQYDYS